MVCPKVALFRVVLDNSPGVEVDSDEIERRLDEIHVVRTYIEQALETDPVAYLRIAPVHHRLDEPQVNELIAALSGCAIMHGICLRMSRAHAERRTNCLGPMTRFTQSPH